MTGKLLPLQLVYQGKTKVCLPTVSFPAAWDVTFSLSHWCNEITMHHYVQNAIVLYVCQCHKENLYLHAKQRALYIFDNFKAQRTDGILKLLENNNIRRLCICTSKLYGRALTDGPECE